MKSLLAFIVLAFTFQIASAQESEVKWYTIEEAEQLIKKEPRPIFVDTYTDWCGWCKKLDKDTFSHPVIAEILNTKFYAVKFDAEGSDEVTFQGKKFINDGKTGKTHQLAISLLQGRLSYPTVVFLTEKGELISPVPGYRTAKDMEPLLIYFAEKKYETTEWEKFNASFKGKVN